MATSLIDSAPASHEDTLMVARCTSISIPASARTQEGFNRWATSDDFPDRCRVSWIRGEILIDMSPEEIESHNKLKTELTRAMATFVKQHRLGECYSDRTLITNEEAELSTEPDFMFASKASIKSRRIWKQKTEQGLYMSLVGSPDFVIELVSKNSVTKDTRLLKKAYQAADVKEYWLIDARKHEMSIQIFSLGKSGFQSVPVKRGRWKSPLFGAEFHLHREQDEFGYWDYTLDFADKG
jgi:Uma2 family endonuclease